MDSTKIETRRPRIRLRRKRLGVDILLIVALIITLQYSQPFVCNAEDVGDDIYDFYSVDDDDYYTPAPTSKPPTITPTTTPTTSPPTSSPTDGPTAHPSVRPSRARIDFYEVDIDDYTVEAQFAETYISSISDVILCLLCTFFWILWLVGTIFPTKIQHLYKSEGVVVRGDVLEAYVSHSQGSPAAPDTVPGEDSGSEMNVVTTGGDTFDALNDLPSYHAIVSYVVPGPVALGRRRIRRIGERLSPQNNYQLQTEGDNVRTVQQTIHGTVTDHALEELSSKLSVDHVKASMSVKGTPPRPPRTTSFKVSPKKVVSSPDSTDSLQFEMRNRKLSRISENGVKQTNEKSLIDTSDSRSQDDASTKPISERKRQNEKMGFYKYNKYDKSDYGQSGVEGWEDEYENPEMIGNLFYSLGLSGLVMNKDKPLEKKPSPVRVKKRFETNELLKRGSKCVEIIVLPGNPGSGILKDEFEQEEDYMLTGTVSQDQESKNENEGQSSQMGDATAAIIGVILSAVSVIGAVHGALTLPYQKRIYGWVLVIGTLSLMWPIAMLTYKSVNRLRLFMLNKIISFEPCGDKTGLYGLSKLPRAKLTSCSVNSGKGSDGSGAEYVIMLDTNDTDANRGIWSQDESSAVSSLSGDRHHIV